MAQQRRGIVRAGVMTLDPPAPPVRSARDLAELFGPGLFPYRDERPATSGEVVYVDAGPGGGTTESAVASIVEFINDAEASAGALTPLLRALAAKPQLVTDIAKLDSFEELAGLVETRRRSDGLEELRRLVYDEHATVESVFGLLRRESWMFGSHLSRMDSADQVSGLPPNCLPLVRFDAAIHAVLVETPVVGDLVVRNGDDLLISPKVYAMLDRARRIVGLLGGRPAGPGAPLPLDLRRVFVTVLIGHSEHLADKELHREFLGEIRMQNSFYAGFSVITYDELLYTAEQLLPGSGLGESAMSGR